MKVIGSFLFVLAAMFALVSAALAQNDYTYVEWEGLLVPLPPDGEWQVGAANAPEIGGLPVLASAAITYPSSAPVEKPFGPSFVIFQFNGTLQDWIDLERQNGATENPVQEQTIRNITIAGLPAKAYQRAITGTGYLGYYAVKLDANRLLYIVSENISFAKYNAVIDGLRLTSAPATLPDTGSADQRAPVLLGAVLVLGAGVMSRIVLRWA